MTIGAWVRRPRWRRLVLVALAVGTPAAAAVAIRAHHWATAHVEMMTGDPRWEPNCAACHLGAGIRPTLGWHHEVRYLSPLNLAVSPDGRLLYATASESDALLVIEAGSGRRVAAIPVGSRPHGVCLSADGKTSYVTNRWSASVSVLDLERLVPLRTLAVGSGPAGLALSPDGRMLYVANSFSDDISVLELESGRELRRLLAGRRPFDVAAAPDGKRVYVTNLLSDPVPFRAPPVTELTVIDAERQVVAERVRFPNAHLMEGIALAPNRPLALATMVRPKNLLPAVQVARGWMLTNGLGLVSLDHLGSTATSPGGGAACAAVLLDQVDAFYADPCDAVFTRDGSKAYISHSGADAISVVDVSRLLALLRETPEGAARERLADDLGASRCFVTRRIPAAGCPKGLALSPDGRYVYVAAELADRILVIATDRDTVVRTIDLGGPREETLVRRGARLFHRASHTFEGQFSCRSCHPDGHVDGLSYDLEPDGLGRNLVDNRTLQGIRDTAPFKWSGVSPSLYRQCGIRFAAFITRGERFAPDDLNALVAYILSIPRIPNPNRRLDGRFTEPQERGRVLFERTMDKKGHSIPPTNRCPTCHPPALFTDKQKHDVGTGFETDTLREFDTPQLTDVALAPPYLHDGRAATLEEIWTRFGTTDRHGVVNDLSKQQLNDLIEYLSTL